MPAPNPIPCSVDDCEWTSPAGVPTWENMITLLNIHSQAAHGIQGAGQAVAVAQPATKLEPVPRPTFTLNMSEAKWNFTKAQWTSYIGQNPALPETAKLMQLQAACDSDLQQGVYDSGSYPTLNSVETFLEKMKELAVVNIHKSVHLSNLWKMQQQPEETIRAYAARVNATAEMCDMQTKCECGRDVLYRDKVVEQIIIHGMKDADIRIRVKSRHTSNELTTLAQLLDYIAAEEAGKNDDLDSINANVLVGGIRKKSTFQRSKSFSHKCSYCGNAKHTVNNTAEDRQRLCKGYGKSCSRCKKPNHLASVCKSRQATADTRATVANVQQQPNLVQGGQSEVMGLNDESVEVGSLQAALFGIHEQISEEPFQYPHIPIHWV